MVYKIAKLIQEKLQWIQELSGSEFGEWENSEEEHVCESISNICVELEEMINRLTEKKLAGVEQNGK